MHIALSNTIILQKLVLDLFVSFCTTATLLQQVVDLTVCKQATSFSSQILRIPHRPYYTVYILYLKKVSVLPLFVCESKKVRINPVCSSIAGLWKWWARLLI